MMYHHLQCGWVVHSDCVIVVDSNQPVCRRIDSNNIEVSALSRVFSHSLNVVSGLIVHITNFAYAKCVYKQTHILAALSFSEIFRAVPIPLQWKAVDKHTKFKWTLSEMTIVDMEYESNESKTYLSSHVKSRVRFFPIRKFKEGNCLKTGIAPPLKTYVRLGV